MANRTDWTAVLARAAEIVDEYDAQITLRQLFYRLVAEGLLDNTKSRYANLSRLTAAARRDEGFPALEDRNRAIYSPASWEGPGIAKAALREQYRRDRTAGQEYNILVGVEKDALSAMFKDWLDRYGIPLLVLKGYASQSFKDEVSSQVLLDGRETVFLYCGDHDASGHDIYRDFVERTGLDMEIHRRLAVTPEQIEEHGLPEAFGKDTDSRAADFIERYGDVQVELDALPPDVLKGIVLDAIHEYWDDDAFSAVLRQELEDLEDLA